MEDGWEICVLIEDLQMTRRVRVRGETHIGGLMLRLVEAIDVKMDWSDHGLWWPEQNRWLLKTRHTLDQSGLQADSVLEFHRMHNKIRVQLPDLQEQEVRVNFAQSVFGVVVGVCKDLGIRHPEELSLRMSPPRPADVSNGTLGSRFSSFRRSKGPKASPSRIEAANANGSYNTLMGRQTSQSSPKSPKSEGYIVSPVSINSLAFEGAELACLANSPYVSARSAFTDKGLTRAKSPAERAALNESWLDSSRSLMEQGVRPTGGWAESGLQLRYKFHAFYDLNIKYDSVRINQIYEQVKWSLLSEELECTEEEMLLLAALQLQIHLTSSDDAVTTTGRGHSTLGRNRELDDRDTNGGGEVEADDEIDAALAELENSLMSDACLSLGSPTRLSSEYHIQQQQQTKQNSPGLKKMPEQMPELAGFLKFFKPRKYTLRGYKRYYFVLRETHLAIFPDQGKTRPVEEFNLVGAETAPDVNASTHRFGIKLFVPSDPETGGQMQELWLRCDTKDQYAEWSAAICLAARGKTLASRAAFEAEVKATSAQLDLQAPKPQPQLTLDNAPDIDPADYVSSRHLKGRKNNWLLQGILERHANVRDRSLIDAKLDYIKVCQRLPMYGVAYFSVQCSDGPGLGRSMSFQEYRKEKQQKGRSVKREELIGVAPNRLMRLEAGTGQIINTWRYEELQSWTVNWEVLSLKISLNRPPHSIVLVPCPSAVTADSKQSLCKTLAEFIGGNVFLSLRQPEKNQQLSEQMFHKLTGSRDPNEYR